MLLGKILGRGKAFGLDTLYRMRREHYIRRYMHKSRELLRAQRHGLVMNAPLPNGGVIQFSSERFFGEKAVHVLSIVNAFSSQQTAIGEEPGEIEPFRLCHNVIVALERLP